jgi:soluble lytic murein transglycosylase
MLRRWIFFSALILTAIRTNAAVTQPAAPEVAPAVQVPATTAPAPQPAAPQPMEAAPVGPDLLVTEVTLFQKGYESFKDKEYQRAVDQLTQALSQPKVIRDYVYFYRAQSYMALKKWKEAEKDLQEISAQESHFKLVLDSRILLAQVFFEMNQPAQVKPLFARLLRRIKVTEDEPRVLFMMAKSEKQSGQGKGCQYLLQLYKKFPDYAEVKHWDADLDKNEFLGSPTECKYDTDDFQERMRSLLFAGLDKKAYAEMVVVSGRIHESEPLMSDVLRSQFDLQEGDTVKAYDLLKPHLNESMNDPEFLLNFASTASRAGDNLIGSSAYWYVAKNFPNTKFGPRAHFLAAVMSYQFQDYDGAEYRFKEFARLYPRNPLAKEVGWHLAWLDYLRGHYDSSIDRLKDLAKKYRRNRAQLPRIQYWLAMSYLRTDKNEKAREIFSKLAQDSLRNYYAIAAQARLESTIVKNKSPFSFFRNRLSSSQYMMPDVDSEASTYEEYDEEQNETSFVLDEEDRDQLDEQADASQNQNEDDTKEVEEVTEIKSPILAKRFERAKILTNLGLNEWAKWENYEIEKKTRNKDYLKTLIQDYQKLEQFHRSSQLAQGTFAAERSKSGYLGAKFLWEASYPKAYASLVDKWTDKENIPQELAWAIMKQESQFKKEAISPVGALGLMQIMPVTGYKMSHLRGDGDFSPSQLLTPPKAIELGSAYLRRLSKKMNENYGLVAAAYNAGPHRVDIWEKSFGHLDADEFIEHIPFAETRNYVKKVLTNMQIYRELYSGKKDLFTKLNKKFDYEVKGPVGLKEDWDSL